MRGRPEAVPWWGWLAVLALALALRLYASPTTYYPDEAVYIQHAWNLAHGELQLGDDSWYIHRLPVYVPAAAFYLVAGVGKATTVAWPFLLSLVQLLLLMAVAHVAGGRRLGLLAGLLLAMLPVDILESTHLMPDVVMGTLMSITALLWWLSGHTSGGRGRGALLFLAGASLGLATLARPYALVLGVSLLIGQLLARRRVGELVLVAAGGALVLASYLAVYQLAVGDALYRVEVVSQAYSSGKLAEPARFLAYPKMVAHPLGPLGLHGLALLAVVAPLLVRPTRPVLLLLAWSLPVALLLQFGSMSLERYEPILKRARFLTPLGAPLCFLLAMGLTRASGWLAGRAGALRPAPLLALALAVLAGASLLQVHGVRSEGVDRYRALEAAAREIDRHPDLPVLVDHWRTAIALGPHVEFFGGRGFYFGADDEPRMSPGSYDGAGRLGYVAPGSGAGELPPSLLLLDRHNFRNEAPLEIGGDADISYEPLVSRAGIELHRLHAGSR